MAPFDRVVALGSGFRSVMQSPAWTGTHVIVDRISPLSSFQPGLLYQWRCVWNVLIARSE
ncbi:MAG: hypothetical protein C7B43_12330 [Sulfobacillus benefaciens]|uniref:Uncharacterized protein n=1 Tax=Sulfobacillus benefaciens TaxID=453960 RepID=A0A2T2WXZ3_9FIRM|nr:MAG: hypothetical protein C7B43_12330 [Sulfobacillus benefaciens]HBQ94430.1 hypothetical protein [Sulfobacillus sp.]